MQLRLWKLDGKQFYFKGKLLYLCDQMMEKSQFGYLVYLNVTVKIQKKKLDKIENWKIACFLLNFNWTGIWIRVIGGI